MDLYGETGWISSMWKLKTSLVLIFLHEEPQILVPGEQLPALVPCLPVDDPPQKFTVLVPDRLHAVGAFVDRIPQSPIEITDPLALVLHFRPPVFRLLPFSAHSRYVSKLPS